MKTPLSIMTGCFSIGFFDGVFMLGFSDDLYMFVGFAMLASIVWMWIIECKK